MNELLQQLTEVVGVSGAEQAVRALLRDLITPHVDEWRVDTMGNLIALKKGTGEVDLRVMVDAHMDEVGLMLAEVDSQGTFKFFAVGGFEARSLVGKVVQVGPKRITGVIGIKPIHDVARADRKKVPKIESLRIDIGARSKEAAKGKVSIGDRATFMTAYEEIGPTAVGKAFDDRAGCAALVELLRGEPYPFDLCAVFSVQEEVGLRGARVAAYSVQPDVALVLECTPAYDLPREDESPNVALGRGPGIYVMDAGTVQDPRLVAHLAATADAAGIPYQFRRPGGGGTNAGAIQRSRGAVPTATIGLPGRYLHAPASLIHLDDYAHMVRLADSALRGLTPELLAT